MNVKNLSEKVKLALRKDKFFKHEFLNFEIKLTRDNKLEYLGDEYLNSISNINLIVEMAMFNYYTNMN